MPAWRWTAFFPSRRSPLRFVTVLDILTAALASAGIFYSLIVRIFTPHWVAGWATLILAVLFIGE